MMFFIFQICRDECEVLEYSLCHRELEIARAQPLISHQLVLPDCAELPVVGATASYNCVRLGLPQLSDRNQLLKPHSCYAGDEGGKGYRGTASVTRSGRTCKPWYLTFTRS